MTRQHMHANLMLIPGPQLEEYWELKAVIGETCICEQEYDLLPTTSYVLQVFVERKWSALRPKNKRNPPELTLFTCGMLPQIQTSKNVSNKINRNKYKIHSPHQNMTLAIYGYGLESHK